MKARLGELESNLWRLESLAYIGAREAIGLVHELSGHDASEPVYFLRHQFETIAELAKKLSEDVETAARAA